MLPDLLHAVASWKTLVVTLLAFGFAPGAALRVIVLAFHRDDPRRAEMLGELHRVARWERPFWVVEQLEVALFEGVWERLLWAGAGRLYNRWHLGSGVKQNRKHPETFWIPGEEEKRLIRPGNLVKLMFDTTDLWGRRNWGERMWVKVIAINKRHIVGQLRNQPIGIPRLDWGDRVKFRPDHIIDFDYEPEPDDYCESRQEASDDCIACIACQDVPGEDSVLRNGRIHSTCNFPSDPPHPEPPPPA